MLARAGGGDCRCWRVCVAVQHAPVRKRARAAPVIRVHWRSRGRAGPAAGATGAGGPLWRRRGPRLPWSRPTLRLPAATSDSDARARAASLGCCLRARILSRPGGRWDVSRINWLKLVVSPRPLASAQLSVLCRRQSAARGNPARWSDPWSR